MKSRFQFFTIIALFVLIFGIALLVLLAFSTQNQEPVQLLTATINRDCAPWDGAAFSMSVQYDPATVIYISIWRSPNIKFASTFVLPGNGEQVGSAYILPELGPYIRLSGEISLQRVAVGMPLEGRFRFTSERGEQFEGGFVAEWGSQIVYCG